MDRLEAEALAVEKTLALCRAMAQAAYVRAALVADNYPAHTHGALATDPSEAAAQTAREISAAIRALAATT